jgi:hypothetical protein
MTFTSAAIIAVFELRTVVNCACCTYNIQSNNIQCFIIDQTRRLWQKAAVNRGGLNHAKNKFAEMMMSYDDFFNLATSRVSNFPGASYYMHVATFLISLFGCERKRNNKSDFAKPDPTIFKKSRRKKA